MKIYITFQFLIFTVISAFGQSTIKQLSPLDFEKKLKLNPTAQVVDVRTPEEYNNGFISQSVNYDISGADFIKNINQLDRHKPIFVYCLAGGRSAQAVDILQSQGFKEIYELKGGILAWNKNKLPLSTPSSAPKKLGGISADTYKSMLVQDSIVLVDFYAPWCGPCKKMETFWPELTQEFPEIKIVRLNIDENKWVIQGLQIDEIPVIRLYRNGQPLWSHYGFIPKNELTAKIRNR